MRGMGKHRISAGRGCRGAGLLLTGFLTISAPPSGPSPAVAQTTLDRTPNIGGAWTNRVGTLHFHFMHRFQVTDPPARKVLNSPTFLLAAGLPGETLLGGRYASNSTLVQGQPNEWEIFGRFAPLRMKDGRPFDVGVQASYSGTAESMDGELLLARRFGPLRILGGARAFSSFAGEGEEAALMGGTSLRLHRHVALAADVAKLLTTNTVDAAWSEGLQLEIPSTPHSLSIQVSNDNTTTLQGSVLGTGVTRDTVSSSPSRCA